MNERVQFLANTELFGGVPLQTLDAIVTDLEELHFGPGDTLFSKGEPGDAVYVICDGRLRLESDGVHLVTRGYGECVGEYALVDDGPRSASAIADTELLALRWERSRFQAAMQENPEVARGIFRILTQKLRQDITIHVDYAVEKERWRQDLQRAREIQMGMLPHADVQTPHTTVSGFCQPAVEVGGDYFDYLPTESGNLGVMIGDVTGHGFYAGLFVAMIKSALHTLGSADHEPADVMLAMRRTLSLSIQRRLLMSCCYVEVDASDGVLNYANAGHPYPIHYRRTTGELMRLEGLDPILGALDLEGATYRQAQTEWRSGDLLVMYTDGITEERNKEGRMFGEDALDALVRENAHKETAEIKHAILHAVFEHCGMVPQSDDITLVVIKAR